MCVVLVVFELKEGVVVDWVVDKIGIAWR